MESRACWCSAQRDDIPAQRAAWYDNCRDTVIPARPGGVVCAWFHHERDSMCDNDPSHRMHSRRSNPSPRCHLPPVVNAWRLWSGVDWGVRVAHFAAGASWMTARSPHSPSQLFRSCLCSPIGQSFRFSQLRSSRCSQKARRKSAVGRGHQHGLSACSPLIVAAATLPWGRKKARQGRTRHFPLLRRSTSQQFPTACA